MARYIKEIPWAAQPDAVFQTVYQFLSSEGYEYTQYQGETVFKKGKGVWTGPTFLKLSHNGSAIRLEAWMKYALLPGVYVGEFGLTGFFGAAVKGPLKRRVAYIEEFLAKQQPTVQAAPNQFCTNCGAKLPQGAAFCPSCGQKSAGPAQ